MRLLFFYIALCLSGIAFANPQDSVVEGRVMSQLVISSNRPKHTLFALRDSIILSNSNRLSIGEFLERNAAVSVQNYGAPGALITARFNGTSSDHTLLLWNELPLANPALGLADLSLIPVAFLNGVEMSTGAVSDLGGISGIGATLQLSDFDHLNGVKLSISHNTLSNQNIVAQLGFRKKAWSSISQLFIANASNEFEYEDIYSLRSPSVKQSHNNSQQRAFQQQVDYRSSNGKHHLKLVGFYQFRHYNVPVIMGLNRQGTAHQRDSTLRASLSYVFHKFWGKKFLNSSVFQVFSTLNNEHQRYTDRFSPSDEVLSIDSRLSTLLWLNGARFQANSFFFLDKAVVDFKHYTATAQNTNFANGRVEEPFYSANFSFEKKVVAARLKFNGYIYQEWRTNFKTEPSFGFDGQWKISHRHIFFPIVMASASRRYRVPDFNERFWAQGGNPNLLPEDGLTLFGRLFWDFSKEEKYNFSYLLEYGIQDVQQWIQWVPRPNWTPVNYKETKINYFKSQLEYSAKWGKNVIHLKGIFNHVVSDFNNENSGRDFELIYTPRNTWSGQLTYQRSVFSAGVATRFVDARFTNENNDLRLKLPAYFVTDVFIGCKFKAHNIQFYVDNVLDERFESVRAHAMPGRIFGVSYQYHFNFNSIKK